jgi:clan AA aspartic protease
LIVGDYEVAKSQVVVDLVVFGPNGDSIEGTATIDTGFTGFLMLPGSMTRDLGLRPLKDVEIELADGSAAWLQQYDAEIEWDGRRLRVPVYASRGEPLVGMKLLRGHLVTLELIRGGSITIERAA